jgi:hypothetical protein
MKELAKIVIYHRAKHRDGDFSKRDWRYLFEDLKDYQAKQSILSEVGVMFKDKNTELSDLGTNLIKEIEKKVPYIQLPNDEDLYMALHKLKQAIKDNF